jgi:hypothetical protein
MVALPASFKKSRLPSLYTAMFLSYVRFTRDKTDGDVEAGDPGQDRHQSTRPVYQAVLSGSPPTAWFRGRGRH